MIRSIVFIILLSMSSLANAGYIALTKDEVTARIDMAFQLEAGGTLTYSEQSSGSSFTAPHVSRDVGYYTADDEGTAQAEASLDLYGSYFDLFTETEQYGDGFIYPGAEILPGVVADDGGLPLVDVLARVNLDWRFRVYDDPVTLQAIILAEHSLETDSYLRLYDLTHHQLVFELVGGWMNEAEFTLLPGIRYALKAQSLEFNGDDDIETEVYFGFGSGTPIVSAAEPESLSLFALALLLLTVGRVARSGRR